MTGTMRPLKPLTDEQVTRMRDVFGAIGIKGEFQRIAARMLRDTPEYARARRERRARAWLAKEAGSAAEMLYANMLARMKYLEP